MVEYVGERMAYLETSRPTAVNLFKASRELREHVAKKLEEVEGGAGAGAAAAATGTTPELTELIKRACVEFAQEMLKKDVDTNMSIGDLGAEWIVRRNQEIDPEGAAKRLCILTHCNTG